MPENAPPDPYARYAPALLRKAQRLLQNREDALDVVQALFVDLLSSPSASPNLPYLYRAVTNRCLTLLRNRANRYRLLERQAPALRGLVRTTCDETVVGLDLLLKLTHRLDRQSQEVLVYRFVDDMTQEEIAQVMGTSRKTVGKRLAKIRKEIHALR